MVMVWLMSKGGSAEALMEKIRTYWERECSDYDVECIKSLGAIINNFEEWAIASHRGAIIKKEDAMARISETFTLIRSYLSGEVGREIGDIAYKKLYETRFRWYSQNVSEAIGEALVNAFTTNPEATPRDIVESVITQTGYSPVTVRHWFDMLAHEYPDYREYATEARRIEREVLGV